MDIELLWSAGCPNWRETAARLHRAVAAAGVEATISLVEVSTAEQAAALEFRGSPTVLVDGTDPFADGRAPVGLSCRVFSTPDGLRGAPTLEQLIGAVRERP